MYINFLHLKNFKCFKEFKINLPKLTVITGANSSGKSSVIYSVLGAIQTNKFPFYYSPNGNYVQMGDYKQLIFNHKKTESFSLNFNLAEAPPSKNIINYLSAWKLDSNTGMPILKNLNLKSETLNLQIKHEPEYEINIDYYPEEDAFFKIAIDGLTEEYHNLLNSIYSFLDKAVASDKKSQTNIEGFKTFLTEKQPIKAKFKFNKIEELTNINFINKAVKNPVYGSRIHSLMSKQFDEYAQNINFISSFRLAPERMYYQKSKSQQKVGKFGEGYIDQILEWESQKSEKYKKLLKVMYDLKLSSKIRSKKLHGGMFEILVKIPTTKVENSLYDVGFGISQFLPIIIADLQLSNSSTLFLSQPEIHLHPSTQALMANYIIEQVRKTQKRYVIETHSEYFLNRLRLLIVKKNLSPDDLNIVFLRNTKEGTRDFKIEFTDKGSIKNAPKDFFDTNQMDVIDIAMQA